MLPAKRRNLLRFGAVLTLRGPGVAFSESLVTGRKLKSLKNLGSGGRGVIL